MASNFLYDFVEQTISYRRKSVIKMLLMAIDKGSSVRSLFDILPIQLADPVLRPYLQR